MSKAELDEEFDKFREEYNQEPRKNIRKKMKNIYKQ